MSFPSSYLISDAQRCRISRWDLMRPKCPQLRQTTTACYLIYHLTGTTTSLLLNLSWTTRRSCTTLYCMDVTQWVSMPTYLVENWDVSDQRKETLPSKTELNLEMFMTTPILPVILKTHISCNLNPLTPNVDFYCVWLLKNDFEQLSKSEGISKIFDIEVK